MHDDGATMDDMPMDKSMDNMPMDKPVGNPVDKPQAPPPPQGGGDLQARAAEMAAAIPPARAPLKRATVEQVVEAFNDAMDATFNAVASATGGDKAPAMSVPPGDTFEAFPAEVYVPAALLLEEAQSVVPGNKYKCDPAKLATPEGVRELAAKLSMLASDKKVKAAVKQTGEQAKADVPAAPPTPPEDAEMLAASTSRPA